MSLSDTKSAPVRRRTQLRNRVSPREIEVLDLLYLSNREIATILGIKPGTVKSHLKTAFAKLGVENRTQAALVWQQRNSPAWRETRAA